MLSGMASSLASRVTGGGSVTATQVVNVVVGEIEAAVDLGMSVDYGENIPQVADAVRSNIIGRIQAMTGLIVKEVNIDVTDLYFPGARIRPRRRSSSGANAPIGPDQDALLDKPDSVWEPLARGVLTEKGRKVAHDA